MTVARGKIIDTRVTRYYHCFSECVRGARLCGDGYQHRKQWLKNRVAFLSRIFAIDTCSFAVLDNHFHTLLRINPGQAKAWSDREVVVRWGRISPKRDKKGNPLKPSPKWVKEKLKDARWVAKIRKRLRSISWFMKYLKEPLSRMANKEEGIRGHFWAGRFRSIPVKGKDLVLITSVCIDLSPFAAGICKYPELSPFTSLHARVQHLRDLGGLAAETLSPGGPAAEESHWLCPIEDRRDKGGEREGMFLGFTLKSYLELVEWSSRIYRNGKARLSQEAVGLLDRLPIPAAAWATELRRMLDESKTTGLPVKAKIKGEPVGK